MNFIFFYFVVKKCLRFWKKFFEKKFLDFFFVCKIFFFVKKNYKQKKSLKNDKKWSPIFGVIFWPFFDPLFGGSKKGSKNGPKTQKTPFFGQKTQKIEFFLIFPTPIFAFFAFPHPPLPKILGGGPFLDPKKRPFLGLFRGPNQRGF